jgi:SAM-dependent methyltransferase
MTRLRRNEWNFASNAAELITNILRNPEFKESPLGHAEAELTELRGVRRLDLVLFSRQDPLDPMVTGELKVPWDPLGRTPYNTKLVEDAHAKATRTGAVYFITWNIRRVVVWKTDDPGVALLDRVIFDHELVPSSLTLASIADLDRTEVRESLAVGVGDLVAFLDSALTGLPAPSFLPLDRLFIARLESALYYPIQTTATEIDLRMHSDAGFKRAVERWMRDVQGWIVNTSNEAQNISHAARFTCYVLVNRLCFYDALRRKYRQLPRLIVPNNINTGEALQRRLTKSFNDAKRFTGNYETVFDGDYGDTLPFLSDDAVSEWRSLIRSLDHYDFANISLDVIGAMYEQLIKPAERHRYGQHYTQPSVVDLITSFAIRTGHERVLDPGCGGGTFLVRAYARKAYLDDSQDHAALLETLYGADILNYACHLSIINLAIRDLIDDDNFPRIHLGDFLRLTPRSVFSDQPTRVQAGGLVTGKRHVVVAEGSCDAIIGNPPYINAREMRAADKVFYHNAATAAWPEYPWRRAADIYTYFWLHAEQFLTPNGYLTLLTQAAWLDGEYGIPLQRWMLDHFAIVAVLETEVEPWFTDARVATVVTILKRESDPALRSANSIRFVQFRSRLADITGNDTSECGRQSAFEQLRNELLQTTNDVDTPKYRLRLLTQGEIAEAGTDANGQYVGSKWGRYLRSTQTLYDLQRMYPTRFVPLGTLATVQRGITTNCDDFFLVSDVSKPSLDAVTDAREFRARYATRREQVVSGEVKIVRRKDGVELPLETAHLRPIIKTARDVKRFITSVIDSELAVVIAENRRQLSALARRYVEAGEREGWHLLPSFAAIQEGGGNWYTLRTADAAGILFIKTMQYSPIVLWNDAEMLTNQRLYTVKPNNGLDALALCGVLNSTLFACERYAAVKALGREAAIDVEVFSATAYKTPDIRLLGDGDVEGLRFAMRNLAEREVHTVVEERLMRLGHAAAVAYAATTPINQDVWPIELRDPVRADIDRIVLRLLGVSEAEIDNVRERMLNDLISYTRKLRILELEAQINRQGLGDQSGPPPRVLADEIWTQLVNSNQITQRRIPEGFLPPSSRLGHAQLSGAPVTIEQPGLFDSQPEYVARTKSTVVMRGSLEEVRYISLLAEYGVSGQVTVPLDSEKCRSAMEAIQAYHELYTRLFQHSVEEITSDVDLQRRIIREGWKRVIN